MLLSCNSSSANCLFFLFWCISDVDTTFQKILRKDHLSQHNFMWKDYEGCDLLVFILNINFKYFQSLNLHNCIINVLFYRFHRIDWNSISICSPPQNKTKNKTKAFHDKVYLTYRLNPLTSIMLQNLFYVFPIRIKVKWQVLNMFLFNHSKSIPKLSKN